MYPLRIRLNRDIHICVRGTDVSNTDNTSLLNIKTSYYSKNNIELTSNDTRSSSETCANVVATAKTTERKGFECFSATNTHFQFGGAERSHFK